MIIWVKHLKKGMVIYNPLSDMGLLNELRRLRGSIYDILFAWNVQKLFKACSSRCYINGQNEKKSV